MEVGWKRDRLKGGILTQCKILCSTLGNKTMLDLMFYLFS
jgi:hypothetical protein